MTQPNPQHPVPEALDPLPRGTQAVLRTGTDAVAYYIPVEPLSGDQSAMRTTIALPAYSRWTSGLHFHTKHTEYLRLVRGSIFVELDGKIKVLSAQAGGEVNLYTGEVINPGLIVEVARYARHNWGCAMTYFRETSVPAAMRHLPEDMREDVVVEEWTDPEDIGKPLFFWNLNGVITKPSTTLSWGQRAAKALLGDRWIPFQLFLIFWQLDNWPVFLHANDASLPFMSKDKSRKLGRFGEYATTLIVLFTVNMLGSLLGLRAVSKDRTPDDLWEAYKRDGL